MAPAPNNPKHGDEIVLSQRNTLGGDKLVASFKFQQFLDSLGALETREALAFFVAAGYGGIEQTGSPAMADIDSTFQTIAFDAATLTTPRGVTQDFANDALIFLSEGIWQITVQLTISFVDINSGRELQVRFFDVDTASPSVTTDYFVGRNQAGINISFSLNSEIASSIVGDKFAIQIGSAADTFTGVANEDARYEANHISEFLGT